MSTGPGGHSWTVSSAASAISQQYGVTVTATSVVNGKVNMGFKVDDTPNS